MSLFIETVLRRQLRALGGRELSADELWHTGERYGVSIGGRRFVFRDPTAFSRFAEFVRAVFADRRVESMNS
ncbi:MAG: hypothetical protein NZ578_06020 [Candidatus Binatia bacterium]|nr:hypothetical protein [Candidatus Binatia bacterium]